jgi:hypothetical protein
MLIIQGTNILSQVGFSGKQYGGGLVGSALDAAACGYKERK